MGEFVWGEKQDAPISAERFALIQCHAIIMKLPKTACVISMAALMLYAVYLHLKIHALNRLVVDECAVRAEIDIELYRKLHSGDVGRVKLVLENFLQNDWKSFHEGRARNHAGSEIWKYKIGKALSVGGFAPANENPDLREFLEEVDKAKMPAGDVEFYQAWDNPMLSWWPRW